MRTGRDQRVWPTVRYWILMNNYFSYSFIEVVEHVFCATCSCYIYQMIVGVALNYEDIFSEIFSRDFKRVNPFTPEVSAHSLVMMYLTRLKRAKNILQNEVASNFALYQNIDPSESSMIFR